MKINDIILEESVKELRETRMAWAKRGNKVVKKYRCTSGPRKGRVVADPAQCSKPIDMKKRMQLKRTKARMGSRIKRKTARTKRVNPASKMVRKLNK